MKLLFGDRIKSKYRPSKIDYRNYGVRELFINPYGITACAVRLLTNGHTGDKYNMQLIDFSKATYEGSMISCDGNLSSFKENFKAAEEVNIQMRFDAEIRYEMKEIKFDKMRIETRSGTSEIKLPDSERKTYYMTANSVGFRVKKSELINLINFVTSNCKSSEDIHSPIKYLEEMYDSDNRF